MSQFWSPSLHHLKPYVPGEQPKPVNLTKLNTNENPYGPSPKVLDALRAQASDVLRLYPDPNSDELCKTIADYYQLNSKQVFVGNGSDEVLAQAFFAFFRGKQAILFPDITYSFYPVYCGLYEINYNILPLNNHFEIDVQDYMTPNGGIIFPNPNAPTGIYLGLSEIEKLLKENSQSVVIIDEAYCDFGGDSAVKLLPYFPNLLVVRTMSKSRSLAGLRVGYALGSEDLIEGLHRVKDSFNSYPLDKFAQVGAIAAFKDHDYFQTTRDKVIQSRELLVKDLTRLGFDVLPSKANFIFATHKKFQAEWLLEKLREENIIVRRFSKPERINNFLRISIGDESQCEKLVKTFEKLVKQF